MTNERNERATIEAAVKSLLEAARPEERRATVVYADRVRDAAKRLTEDRDHALARLREARSADL